MYKLFVGQLNVNTDARIDASVWLLSREESYFTFQLLFNKSHLSYSFVFSLDSSLLRSSHSTLLSTLLVRRKESEKECSSVFIHPVRSLSSLITRYNSLTYNNADPPSALPIALR